MSINLSSSVTVSSSLSPVVVPVAGVSTSQSIGTDVPAAVTDSSASFQAEAAAPEIADTYRKPVSKSLIQTDTVRQTMEEGSVAVSERGYRASQSQTLLTGFRSGSYVAAMLEQGLQQFESRSGSYSWVNDGIREPLTETGRVTMLYGYREERLSFSLTTRSGVTLNLGINHQTGEGRLEDGRIINVDQWLTSFTADAQLTLQERKDVLKLATSLEGAAARYLSTGRFDLSALGLDKLESFSSLQIEMHGAGDDKGADLLALDYQDSEETRTLSVLLHKDQLDLQLNKDGWAVLGSRDQRQQSLEEYLLLIEDSARRGGTGAEQTDLMQDAFRLLHHLDKEEQIAAQEEEIIAETPTGIDVNYAAAGLRALSGLEDFHFSFVADITQPNPDPAKEYEKVSFELSISQQTTGLTGDPGQLQVEQTQSYQMQASYYEPLLWLKAVDFVNQSYRYIETEATATKVTGIGYDDFNLTGLFSQSQNEWQEHTRTYVEGVLDGNYTDAAANDDIRDFTEAAVVAEREQRLDMLDELLGRNIPDPWMR